MRQSLQIIYKYNASGIFKIIAINNLSYDNSCQKVKDESLNDKLIQNIENTGFIKEENIELKKNHG